MYKKEGKAMAGALEKKKDGKKHKHMYKKGECVYCGKSSEKNYEELPEEDKKKED